MNRRGFLQMIAGAAAGAAVRTFPFRVFSFPSEIKTATLAEQAAIDPLVAKAAEELGYRAGLSVDALCRAAFLLKDRALIPKSNFYAVIHPITAKELGLI